MKVIKIKEQQQIDLISFTTSQELKPSLQGVVSPADPSLAPEVLKAQMEDADTKLIICCTATLNKVRMARGLANKDIPILVMGDEAGDMELFPEREKTLSDLYQVILQCRYFESILEKLRTYFWGLYLNGALYDSKLTTNSNILPPNRRSRLRTTLLPKRSRRTSSC